MTEQIRWFFIIFVGGLLFCLCFKYVTALPVGTHCLIETKTYGAKDLKESYEVLEKAKRANDEFGFAELTFAGKAAPLDGGVACLVLDTNLWSHFRSYRQIRVLTGAYAGQVFWVQQDDLKEGWPSTTSELPPKEPIVRSEPPCNYANETRDALGTCVCETGYRRDPRTDQCVPSEKFKKMLEEFEKDKEKK